MSEYAKIENGSVAEFPYSFNNLKRDNPLVSFPKGALSNDGIRSDYGIVVVEVSEKPQQAGYKAVSASPKLINGSWSQDWELVLKAEDELQPSDIQLPSEVGFGGDPAPSKDGFKVETDGAELVDGVWKTKWKETPLSELHWEEARQHAYGVEARDQIEFITENGLEAWQAKVADIKAKYPKT